MKTFKQIQEDIFSNHQRKIALDTLKLSSAGALIMGGMTHKEAVKFLLAHGMVASEIISKLKKHGWNDAEIADMMSEKKK